MLYFYLQRLYKKDAKDSFGKFTSIMDLPEIVLAKMNSSNLSDVRNKIQHLKCKKIEEEYIGYLIMKSKTSIMFFFSP